MLRYNRKNKNLKIPVGIGTNNNVDSSLLFNVSDGDATAGDLIAGKTAYSAEGFIVGTLDVETEKQNSYNEGYSAGEQDGYVSGEADGYADGYSEGKEDGIEEILTEQSDANITPGSVLEGYIGYGANNERIVGTNVGGFDFGEIGYTEEESNECNVDIKNDIAYTKSLMPINVGTSYRKPGTQFNLVYAPYVDTSSVNDFSFCFENYKRLRYIPKYDFSNATNVKSMFTGCTALTSDIIFDNADNITNYSWVCNENYNIKKFIVENASNATTFERALYQCESLEYVSIKGISDKCTNFSIGEQSRKIKYFEISGDSTNIAPITAQYYQFTFTWAENLKSENLHINIDTHFLTNFQKFFEQCYLLEVGPELNTINGISINSMFRSCYNLVSIPSYNTENVTDISGFLYNCSKLETIGTYNFKKVKSLSNGASSQLCYGTTSLKNIGGFIDFGMGFTGGGNNYLLLVSKVLTRESVMNVFNTIYDLNLNTSYTGTSYIGIQPEVKALLSDEDLAIATNKGWTIQ